MTANSYAGPIADTHVHLWRYRAETYPWLAGEGLEPLRRDHLPVDYARLARAAGIVASVHVEANWRDDDPVAETRWLSRPEIPAGVADRLVAHVPLHLPEAARLIEEQIAFPKVVGIRDILTWHPDPAKSRHATDRLDSFAWRQGFAHLAKAGLAFDLMISPWQVEKARDLIDAFPGTTFAINHCGSPLDRDAEGMARWRAALRLLAEAPNTVIKISDPVAYDPHWTERSLRDVILDCIDAFGPRRAMFGSDYPVAGLAIGFAQWIDVFASALSGFDPREKEALFYGTAVRVYRLPIGSHPR